MGQIRRNRYAVSFYVMLFCLFQCCIYKIYGFSIFPDEFSYWAYAAKAAGYDWSEVVSLGSFYSCGYSVLLFPIFRICDDALTAYRAAVALNFAMIAVGYWFLCRIWKPVMHDQMEECQIYSAVAMLYPAVIFYAQTTMTETLLMLGYLLLLFLFQRYLQEQGYLGMILIFAVNVCMYLVHMRTIGIFAVCVCLLLFAEFHNDRDYRKILMIILLTLVSLCAAAMLKKWTSSYLYQNVDQDLYAVNTYGGQLEKLKYIFSKHGIAAFVVGLCGKILYMGIATYGMAYWGICFLIRHCCRGIRSKRGGIVEAFVLLTVLSQIVISTVYNVIPDSYDSITFGRYHDHVMPVLIVAGSCEIASRKNIMKRYLWITGSLFLAFILIVRSYAAGLGLTEIKGYFMTGMSFFETRYFYMVSFLTGVLCMCCMALWFFSYVKSGSRQILFFCIVLQMLFISRLENNYIEPFNRLAYQDIRMAQKIEGIVQGSAYQRPVIYIDYNDISAIGLMQFVLRDQTIRVIPENKCISDETVDEKSIVLLGAGDPAWEKLQKRYGNEIIGGHFVLLYNDEETWE